MFLDVIKYSFINAKIRAMKSGLIRDAVYQQLLETTQLDAFIKALMETDYASELSAVDTKTPDINEVIAAIDRVLIDNYRAVYKHFMAKREGGFVGLVLSRIEIENLKVIIRGKFKGIPAVMIKDNLVPADGVSSLNFEDLINSKDVEHFVSLLSATRYGTPLRLALPTFERDRRPAVLEIPLDILYFKDIVKTVKTLSIHDYYVMKVYLGTYCDVTNILTILRSRLFFDMPSDEIMSMYIPFGYRFSRFEAVALSKTTEDDYREVFGKTHYGKIVTNFKILSDIEMGLHTILGAQAKKILMGYPFHIGTIIGYLALKETEAANLKSIAEGKRHHLPEGRIRENVVI